MERNGFLEKQNGFLKEQNTFLKEQTAILTDRNAFLKEFLCGEGVSSKKQDKLAKLPLIKVNNINRNKTLQQIIKRCV
jgi:hypothetical protein